MTDHALDNCGCCDPSVPAPAIENPPGLPALSYRVGTHGTFLHRMLRRLPHERIEDAPNQIRYPLAHLATRTPDDPAIALLDAWALVGDVLTFYQERIANEGFLRTATERRSILEQARLIGYELSPGVSASAHLAFTVDTAVRFRADVDDSELDAYVASGEAAGCAGGYMAERRGAWLIEAIEGDWQNVIGLPIFALLASLRARGYRLPQ